MPLNRRYDKWEELRRTYIRCKTCMSDAPTEFCCKMHCGEYDVCKECNAVCRNSDKLCGKDVKV